MGRLDRADQGPRRLGLGGSPRVGCVPARQDEPELLDQRPERHGRCLRGRHRHVVRPHGRRRRGPRHHGVHQGRGERCRALRRHDADVPVQPAPGRPRGPGAGVRLRGDRRGEVRPRLQQRQPGRRPDPHHQRAPLGSSRGHLPVRRDAGLGQPVVRPRCRVGGRGPAVRRCRRPRLPAHRRGSAAIRRRRLPSRRREPRATHHRGGRCSPGPAPDRPGPGGGRRTASRPGY